VEPTDAAQSQQMPSLSQEKCQQDPDEDQRSKVTDKRHQGLTLEGEYHFKIYQIET